MVVRRELERPPTAAQDSRLASSSGKLPKPRRVVARLREGVVMGYLIAGVIILSATLSGWWAALPGPDGVAKAAVVKNGVDAWIAIGITVGLALGIGSLIFGAVDVFGPLR